jgi:hypothetical protein
VQEYPKGSKDGSVRFSDCRGNGDLSLPITLTVPNAIPRRKETDDESLEELS